MAGPPSAIDPGDLFMQIAAMPRPSRLVPFPRKDESGNPLCEVALWVLTQEEMMQSNADTERYVRQTLKDQVAQKTEARKGYEQLFNQRGCVEILWRCCRRPSDITKPFFRTKQDIEKYLTTDECGVLYSAYMRVSADLGPIVSELTEEEMEAWLVNLATGGSAAVPLDSLSWGAQTRLMTFLACRALSSSTDTSSASTPPSDDSQS
jgi:hypothetical protein